MGSTCDYKYIGSFLIKYSIQINSLVFLKYQSFFSVLSCPSSSSPSSTSAKFVYHFGRSANQKLSRWIYQTSVKTQHFKNKSQNLIFWVTGPDFTEIPSSHSTHFSAIQFSVFKLKPAEELNISCRHSNRKKAKLIYLKILFLLLNFGIDSCHI